MIRSLLLLISVTAAAVAQPAGPNLAGQREAMKKLEFLVGKWSGDATVTRGPGGPIQIRQTEEIQYKLGGLVMLIEGTGRDAAGKVVFQALATVSYDDESKTYRFRAYNDGRYLDTELKVDAKGFAWGYDAGPAKVSNTMRLTRKGEWSEVTEFSFQGAPPRRSVEMLLQKVQ